MSHPMESPQDFEDSFESSEEATIPIIHPSLLSTLIMVETNPYRTAFVPDVDIDSPHSSSPDESESDNEFPTVHENNFINSGVDQCTINMDEILAQISSERVESKDSSYSSLSNEVLSLPETQQEIIPPTTDFLPTNPAIHVDLNENVVLEVSPKEKQDDKPFHECLSFWKSVEGSSCFERNHPTEICVMSIFGSSGDQKSKSRTPSTAAIPVIEITPPTEPQTSSRMNPMMKKPPQDSSMKALINSNRTLNNTNAKPAFLDSLPPPPKPKKHLKLTTKKKGKSSTTAINYDEEVQIQKQRPSESGSLRSQNSNASIGSNRSLGSINGNSSDNDQKESGTTSSKGRICCCCSSPSQKARNDRCVQRCVKLRESQRFNCVIFTTIALSLLFIIAFIVSFPIYIVLYHKK